jgi:hypothetical protein
MMTSHHHQQPEIKKTSIFIILCICKDDHIHHHIMTTTTLKIAKPYYQTKQRNFIRIWQNIVCELINEIASKTSEAASSSMLPVEEKQEQ